ncbi:AMP-binding protein [Streptomyces graminilatus]|uniref:AMP-binding protein n=1 Tax=Streptomyces graminilatus TaxID=1464070 RepID=UPI0007C74133|nr:AMP-binding protein [Streptomyces graminilatus]
MTERSPNHPEGPADGLLAASAARHPDRVALVAGDRSLSYAELDAAVTGCAAALLRCTERPGTVVAITSLLSPDFVVGYYGTLRSGNVAAPLNPYLREEQLAHVLGESGTEVALVDAVGAGRIAAVRERLPLLRRIVVLGPPAPDAAPDVVTLDELLTDAEAAQEPVAPRSAGPDDLACLHFTSGTTGAPKTVMLSHRNVLVNAVQVADAQAVDGSSVALNHLPTFHPMHMNSAIAAGATQVLCTAPDPAESVRLANVHRATHYYSLPMRLSALAASEQLSGLRFETVKVIASGGSALSPAHARKLSEHFGLPVVQGYGLAETSPLTHFDDPSDWRPGSVGRPVAGTEARVVDVADGAVLGAGELGEVQLRGPQVMLGYRGESVPSCVDADGWLATSDIGQIDATGRLVLVDRLKDVFKRDNWIVSPTAVERVLERHPAVRDCLVVDYPDPLNGAVATAFVVLAEGAADDAASIAAIAADVNAGMPYYQAVEHIEVVESIPRSPNGKAPRKELRARMERRLRALPHHRPGAQPGLRTDLGGMTMITHITKFTVKGDDCAEFERLFKGHAEFMAAQPGFVDYRMERSTSNPKVYVNVGRWKDAEAHKAVVSSDDFRTHVMAMIPLVEVEADLYVPVSSAGAES